MSEEAIKSLPSPASFSFKGKIHSQYQARVKATAPQPEVDAYVFCTSSKYLGESLFPWQAVLIKIYYGLWKKYPLTPEELDVVKTLKDEWSIDLDLDNRDVSQYVEILILVLGRRCLKYTERVLNPITGERVSIKDLYERKCAAEVTTLDASFKLRTTFAPDVIDNGIQRCYKMTTRTGRTISATANHPFLTINGWKWMSALKPGDKIAVPRKLEVIGKEILPDNEIRLLGFFIGDGHTVEKCNFTNVNPDVISQFESDIHQMSPELVIRQYGIDRSVVQHVGPNKTTRKRSIIQSFIEKHGLRGKHSWDKVVPSTIFESTNRQVALFLNSLFACDGWADSKTIGYSTASKILAEDIQHLLLRFGVNAAIRARRMSYKDKKSGKRVECRIAHRIEISNLEDIQIFADEIGILGKDFKLRKLLEKKGKRVYHNTQAQSVPQEIWGYIKDKVKTTGTKMDQVWPGKSVYRSSQYAPSRDQLGKFGKQFNDKYLTDLGTSDIYWEPITSIEFDGSHQTYDLTVPDTHNFICEDIVTHNSGKSSVISFILTYEAYKLICKGDPQRYYQVRDRHPIWLVTCAKDGDQAQDPFRLCKDNVRRIPFFAKYIDGAKDNESELRLFTPADLHENEKIKKYNDTRTKGSSKRNMMEGSIMLAAFTTSAAGKRGKAIAVLVLDEFAHFDRAKSVTGGNTDEDILAEMPQTDYAMLKALAPSTKDFNIPQRGIYGGRILMISSPREKGGEFYRTYCLAGGSEQTNPNREDLNPHYLLMQLSSWQCNPKYSRDTFSGDFKKDPVGANMEYGAHFGEPSTSFIDSEKIEGMVLLDYPLTYVGQWQKQYIISVDPASKSDTYAVAWGHLEYETNTIMVDGLHGWRPETVINQRSGQIVTIPVQGSAIAKYLIVLANSLSRSGTVLEVVFDQWSSQDSIGTLKAAGIPAVETFFTNSYKNEMYTNFLERLNMGLVKVFGQPPLAPLPEFPDHKMGWLEQMKLELAHLRKITSGNTTTYSHPDSGPVQTDDFADAIANLTHRHVLYSSGDQEVYKKLFKETGRPLQVQRGSASPLRTRNVFGNPPSQRSAAYVAAKLGDRIGRR